MTESTFPSIRRSRDADLELIRNWLFGQPPEIESLKANWSLTRQAHLDGDLWVYEDLGNKSPIAYFWGGLNTTSSIIDIQHGWRRKGIGRQIVLYLEHRSCVEGNSLLEIECAPESSEGFWKKMGFETVSTRGKLIARKALEIWHDLSSSAEVVGVEVRFYPNEVKWKKDTPAFIKYDLLGAKRQDESIQLSRQVGYFHQYEDDLIAEVVVSGHCIYKDKLRYQRARELGFVDCGAGFTLDVLIPPDLVMLEA